MSKAKSIISVILVILLLAGGIWLAIYLNKLNTSAVGTVQLDLNPSVQFMVNNKNKVISVNYLNNDAEIIFAEIKVEGRSVEEVSADFTSVAIEAGLIDISANSFAGDSSNVIRVTITGKTDENSLGNSIIKSINSAFDEFGIFGRAVLQAKPETQDLVDKYKEIATNLKLDISDLQNKTEDEILNLLNEQSQKLEGVAFNLLDRLNEENLNETLKLLKQSINNAEVSIQDLILKLDESGIINKELLQAQLNQLEDLLATKLAEWQTEIDKLIEQLKVESKVLLSNLKTELTELKNNFKAALDAHLEVFNANKEQVLTDINAWRESFNV